MNKILGFSACAALAAMLCGCDGKPAAGADAPKAGDAVAKEECTDKECVIDDAAATDEAPAEVEEEAAE